MFVMPPPPSCLVETDAAKLADLSHSQRLCIGDVEVIIFLELVFQQLNDFIFLIFVHNTCFVGPGLCQTLMIQLLDEGFSVQSNTGAHRARQKYTLYIST